MAATWPHRSEDVELGGLEERLHGAPSRRAPGTGRPASLMDALHDRITQEADVTRNELKLHASVLDELVEHIQRLEARIVELTERPAPTAEPVEPDPAMARMEARLEAHAASVEEGFRRLMDWLDAPAIPAVVDLPAEEAHQSTGA